MTIPVYLTPAQMVELLGKSEDYWRRAARKKQVPHSRIGRSIRFTPADVDAILAAAAVKVTDPLRDDITPRSAKALRDDL